MYQGLAGACLCTVQGQAHVQPGHQPGRRTESSPGLHEAGWRRHGFMPSSTAQPSTGPGTSPDLWRELCCPQLAAMQRSLQGLGFRVP